MTMNPLSLSLSLSKSKWRCSICKKEYSRKSSLERHNILCDYKIKSKTEIIIEEEESSDKPSYDQLVKIVQELSIKYMKMETKVDEMQQWIERKKKKMDIIAWLNANVTSNIGFLEWINITIIVRPEHWVHLMESTIFQTYQLIFEENLLVGEFVCPIKCFSAKNNIFYICEKTEEGQSIWREMELTDFIQLIKKIHNKLLNELTIWKKNNQKHFEDNSKISDKFNKSVIKLMSVSFKQDATMSQIRNTLFNYLKQDLI